MSGVIVGMRDAVVRVFAFIAMASSCNVVAARRPIDRLQRSSDIIACTCQLPLTLLRIVNLHNSPVRALNWVGGSLPPDLRSAAPLIRYPPPLVTDPVPRN